MSRPRLGSRSIAVVASFLDATRRRVHGVAAGGGAAGRGVLPTQGGAGQRRTGETPVGPVGVVTGVMGGRSQV